MTSRNSNFPIRWGKSHKITTISWKDGGKKALQTQFFLQLNAIFGLKFRLINQMFIINSYFDYTTNDNFTKLEIKGKFSDIKYFSKNPKQLKSYRNFIRNLFAILRFDGSNCWQRTTLNLSGTFTMESFSNYLRKIRPTSKGRQTAFV